MAILPQENISILLIAQTLGYPVTYKLGELCIHPNINKWAKWKPVRHSKPFNLTFSDMQSVNFGLQKPPNDANYQNVIGVKWEYNKPRGGANEIYRISDHRRYNTEAPPIIILPSDVQINRTQYPIYFYDTGISRSSETTIGVEDFASEIGNMYVGVVIVKGGSTYMVTANRTISEGDGRIEFNTNTPPFDTVGSGNLYNILSTVAVPNVTLLNNVSPPPLFSSVPIADEDNDVIGFEVIAGININVVLTGIGTTVANIGPANPYIPARASIWQTGKYYEVGDLVQLTPTGTVYRCDIAHISGNFNDDLSSGKWLITLGNQYFNTMGNLYFRASLTNITQQVQSFPNYSLTMETDSTFFGMSYSTGITAYDDVTHNPLTGSITIPAGQTVYVRLGVDNFMNRNNGSIATPVIGTKVTSVFKIRFNGDVIGDGEFNIEAG